MPPVLYDTLRKISSFHTSGVEAFTLSLSRGRHGWVSRTLPESGSSATSPSRVRNTASVWPPISATVGEE
jgi:hypothetical protein